MTWHRRRQTITLLFAAGILLLAAMVATSVLLDARGVRSSGELTDIRNQAKTATEILAALLDMETGARGYLIAGDPAYLEPYYRGRDAVAGIQDRMGPEISRWSGPIFGEQNLGVLIAQRLQLMQAAVDSVDTAGLATAQVRWHDSAAKSVMDKIRVILGYKLEGFTEDFNAVQARSDRAAQLNTIMNGSALGVAILFSILQFILFRSEINGRGAIELILRRRNEERRQLAELSAALQLSETRSEAYAVIEAFARRFMPAISGALYVFSPSRDRLNLAAAWHRQGDAALFPDQMLSSDCWALRQGTRHTGSTDPSASAATAAPMNCNHVGAETGPYTCVPIAGRGQTLAMLHLRGAAFGEHRGKAEFGGAELDGSIERLADQLSLSLTNIELRESLENMALRDGLTGLYNRHFLDEMLERELAKLTREGKQAALLLLDVDHFKRFNDSHGHQAGDEALRRLGRTLKATMRVSDVVCRFGGEEFLVFLPDCVFAEAVAKAETIRAAIAASVIRIGGLEIPPVTVSIGLAMFPALATTRSQLIHLADLALYSAKGTGRNRVVVAKAVVAPAAAPHAAQ